MSDQLKALRLDSVARDLQDAGHDNLEATDFDLLEHVNHAAHWAAVVDELTDHRDLTTRSDRAVIEYLRPFPPGSTMIARRRRIDDQVQMWMVVATVTVTRL